MKIRRLKLWAFGPILLSLPMMCMHLGEGHHDGSHHSSFPQQSQHLSTYDPMGGRMTEEGWITVNQSSNFSKTEWTFILSTDKKEKGRNQKNHNKFQKIITLYS